MADKQDDQTYCIIRFYAPHIDKPNKTVQTGLTRQEAKDHCSLDSSSCSEWFEGFEKEQTPNTLEK